MVSESRLAHSRPPSSVADGRWRARLYVQLDGGHSGSNFTGTVTNGTSIPIEINGGHANTIESMLVIDTRKPGEINCPGTAPSFKRGKYGWQTCDNDLFEQSILRANHWQGEPWISAFPWYKDFCTMADYNGKPCDTQGAYNVSNTTGSANTLCAALPTGNTVHNVAYVFVRPDHSWPGRKAGVFPNSSKAAGFGCKNMGYDFSYAIPDFNSMEAQVNLGNNCTKKGVCYGDPGFAGDARAGDFSIRPSGAVLYKLLPGFVPMLGESAILKILCLGGRIAFQQSQVPARTCFIAMGCT